MVRESWNTLRQRSRSNWPDAEIIRQREQVAGFMMSFQRLHFAVSQWYPASRRMSRATSTSSKESILRRVTCTLLRALAPRSNNIAGSPLQWIASGNCRFFLSGCTAYFGTATLQATCCVVNNRKWIPRCAGYPTSARRNRLPRLAASAHQADAWLRSRSPPHPNTVMTRPFFLARGRTLALTKLSCAMHRPYARNPPPR